MPARSSVDENVRFLYSCITRSDYKTIDFHLVASDFSINPAAARMRWFRMKKALSPPGGAISGAASMPGSTSSNTVAAFPPGSLELGGTQIARNLPIPISMPTNAPCPMPANPFDSGDDFAIISPAAFQRLNLVGQAGETSARAILIQQPQAKRAKTVDTNIPMDTPMNTPTNTPENAFSPLEHSVPPTFGSFMASTNINTQLTASELSLPLLPPLPIPPPIEPLPLPLPAPFDLHLLPSPRPCTPRSTPEVTATPPPPRYTSTPLSSVPSSFEGSQDAEGETDTEPSPASVNADRETIHVPLEASTSPLDVDGEQVTKTRSGRTVRKRDYRQFLDAEYSADEEDNGDAEDRDEKTEAGGERWEVSDEDEASDEEWCEENDDYERWEI